MEFAVFVETDREEDGEDCYYDTDAELGEEDAYLIERGVVLEVFDRHIWLCVRLLWTDPSG